MQNIYKKTGIVASALLSAQMASADTFCTERSKMIEQLAESYGELQTARGIQNTRAVLEIFTSEKGTWTAIITNADGRSCIVAAGKNWEQSTVLPGEKT